MNRTRRQLIIKRLIMENDIHRQCELMDFLKNEGIVVTQATISRDIRELNIIKIEGSDGKTCYRLLSKSVLGQKKRAVEDRLAEILIENGVSLTQIEFSNILVVIPGYGHTLGILIDELREDEPLIVGCVAGDDTVMVLSKNQEDARRVYRFFQQFIFGN